VDTNRIDGTATQFGGKVETGFGNLTGDTKTQAQGYIDQAKGAAQDALGQAGEAVRDAYNRVPPEYKAKADQAVGLAKRNPLVTVALVGIAASAISHLLGVGSRRNS